MLPPQSLEIWYITRRWKVPSSRPRGQYRAGPRYHRPASSHRKARPLPLRCESLCQRPGLLTAPGSRRGGHCPGHGQEASLGTDKRCRAAQPASPCSVPPAAVKPGPLIGPPQGCGVAPGLAMGVSRGAASTHGVSWERGAQGASECTHEDSQHPWACERKEHSRTGLWSPGPSACRRLALDSGGRKLNPEVGQGSATATSVLGNHLKF